MDSLGANDYDRARHNLVLMAERVLREIPDELDLDEAAAYVLPLEDWARFHGDVVHVVRFLYGCITLRVKREEGYGSDAVGRCAERFGIHPNTLRYYVAAAKRLQSNPRQWIRFLQSGGYEKTRKHIVAFTQMFSDEEIVPPEVAAEMVKERIEQAADDVHRMTDPVEQESAAVMLTETAGRVLSSATEQRRLYQTYDPPEAYKAFLSSCYCMGCGASPPDGGRHDTHHVESGGVALKGNDWLQVPLCRYCHRLAHSGYAKFREQTGVDVREALVRVLTLWLSGEDPYLPDAVRR